MKRPIRWWTAAIIMFSTIALLAWDIFAFASGGIDATISDVFTDWLGLANNPAPAAGLGFVVGGLFVHFMGWAMKSPRR
jgi:hypothetical protein